MSVEVRTDGPFIEVRISGLLSNEDFRALAAEARWIDGSEFAGRRQSEDDPRDLPRRRLGEALARGARNRGARDSVDAARGEGLITA